MNSRGHVEARVVQGRRQQAALDVRGQAQLLGHAPGQALQPRVEASSSAFLRASSSSTARIRSATRTRARSTSLPERAVHEIVGVIDQAGLDVGAAGPHRSTTMTAGRPAAPGRPTTSRIRVKVDGRELAVEEEDVGTRRRGRSQASLGATRRSSSRAGQGSPRSQTGRARPPRARGPRAEALSGAPTAGIGSAENDWRPHVGSTNL